MGGRLGAWRALLRIARRDAARSRGRSLMVAVLVALPVLAASGVSVIVRSEQFDPKDVVSTSLGDVAQAKVTPGWNGGTPVVQGVDGTVSGPVDPGAEVPEEPAPLRKDLLPAGAQLTPRTTFYGSGYSIRAGDRSAAVGVDEFAYDAPAVRGTVEQVQGRAPAAAGEVALTEAFAKRLGVGPGTEVTLGVPKKDAKGPRTVTVVGLVRSWGNPDMVLGRPGDLVDQTVDPRSTDHVWYVSGPVVGWDDVQKLNTVGLSVTSRTVVLSPPPDDLVPCLATEYCSQGSSLAGNTASSVAVATVAVGMVLLQVALLAGPALAVGARRNQRTLALVAASGGERRHLRGLVLGNAVVVGLVGSAAAAVAGAGIGAGFLWLAEGRNWYSVPRIDVHPLDLAGLVLIGAATALAAALVPARTAARLDVVAALTGRRGQAAPRLRVPLAGLAVAGGGIALGLWGAQRGEELLVVSGIALGELGLIAAVGAVVSLAARLSSRFPLAPRLALRDAARQRGRTAPAVAAVMAAVAGTVAGLLYISAQDDHDRRGYAPQAASGVAMIAAGYDESGPIQKDWSSVRAALGRTLPVADVVTMDSGRFESLTDASVEAVPAPGRACPEGADGVLDPADPRCYDSPAPGTLQLSTPQPFVDDGRTFAILAGDATGGAGAALAAGKVVVSDRDWLWPDGTVHLRVTTWDEGGQKQVEHAAVTAPAVLWDRGELFAPVLPSAVAERLGLERIQAGVVASTTRLPTQGEEDRARAALDDVSGGDYLSLERGYVSDYGLGLLALLVASALVTLVGTFTAVGLAAAEGRADVATLAAVGASPGVRRRLVAAQAGTIAGLGVAMGLAAGIYAGYVLIRLQQPSVAAGVEVLGDLGGEGTVWRFVLPWGHLAVIAVLVPLLAVTVGFAGVRSRLPLTRRLGE